MTTDRDHEKRLLRQMGQYREGLSGYRWDFEADADGTHIVAVRGGGDAERIATVLPVASPDEIEVLCRSLDMLRLSLDLIDRAKARIATLAHQQQEPEKPKRDNLGFIAKSLCEKPLFRRFLETLAEGGVPDIRAADTRLKFLLNIESKGEIDRDPRAKAAFEKLRNDYWLWKRGDV